MKILSNYFDKLGFILNTTSISIPDFVSKEGLWKHNHSIIVIYEDKEIEVPEFDFNSILGVFKISINNDAKEFRVFDDAIKSLSKRYSTEASLININDELFDSRNTTGAAITAEPTGLLEIDAFNFIQIICKIKLIIFDIIYCRYGKWQSKFYSADNIDFIDLLANNLTKESIKNDQELIACFEWMQNKNIIHSNDFDFDDPISFIINMPGTQPDEWQRIRQLGVFFNCFPTEKKLTSESWDIFWDRYKNEVQDSFINLAKKIQDGWETIGKYLNEETKMKYRGRINATKFGH
jgi:hypothetical protein